MTVIKQTPGFLSKHYKSLIEQIHCLLWIGFCWKLEVNAIFQQTVMTHGHILQDATKCGQLLSAKNAVI